MLCLLNWRTDLRKKCLQNKGKKLVYQKISVTHILIITSVGCFSLSLFVALVLSTPYCSCVFLPLDFWILHS